MDFQTPQFFRVMRYARRADRDVVDLVSGNPDWEPPAGLRDGLREYADAPPEELQYPPSVGLRDLREEIAVRRDVDPDRVLVTNGAGEANHLAMAGALERGAGDEVLLTDPVYPYYAGRANFLDADVGFVAVEDDGHLDPAAVRERASDDTAAVVITTPNNPTGAVYDADAMAALVDVAEAHDALLISDEVYDHFDYSGRFTSALAFDSPTVVATNSFSKSMAVTGFRVGYAVFPPAEAGGSAADADGNGDGDRGADGEAGGDGDRGADGEAGGDGDRGADGPVDALADRARTRHMLTNVTGSRPAQYAVLRGLRTARPDYYAANRRRLADRIDRFCDALDDAGADYVRPEGGFYVLARFEGFPGTFENVYELVDEAGVAAMPGVAFGDARRDWLRFALVSPRVDEAADRLVDYFG